LDESELAERRSSGQADPTRIWGNDGLVTVRSAQYGEWLGVVDGCDHWDTRGANGFSRAWVEGRSGWGQFLGARVGHKWEVEDEVAGSLSSTQRRTVHIDGGLSGNPDGETANGAVPALSDWIADRVSSQAGIPGLASTQSTIDKQGPERSQTLRSSKTGFDLELFYIALARNLYDAGL
jgi:triacylglycerol lipase